MRSMAVKRLESSPPMVRAPARYQPSHRAIQALDSRAGPPAAYRGTACQKALSRCHLRLLARFRHVRKYDAALGLLAEQRSLRYPARATVAERKAATALVVETVFHEFLMR